MADMPFPYYRLQADGPDETGCTIRFQIEDGAGGPLPGKTQEDVVAAIKELLAGDRTTVALSHYEITTITNL